VGKILEMESKRFQFLSRLYEGTGGNQYASMNMWEIGNILGFSRDVTGLIVQYLEGEGLIKYSTLGGGIRITHRGVVQIEKARSEPDKPTQYFPAVNIINVNNMVGSQIQQGNFNSTQTGTFEGHNTNELIKFMEELKEKISQLNLDSKNTQEINAEIATIEAQSKSSRPKNNIIKESLRTIRNIIEGATGSVIATELLAKLAVFSA